MAEEFQTRRGRPRKGNTEPKAPAYVKFSTSLPPDIYERLQRYCDDEEREKAWCLKKAIDPWLKEKGY